LTPATVKLETLKGCVELDPEVDPGGPPPKVPVTWIEFRSRVPVAAATALRLETAVTLVALIVVSPPAELTRSRLKLCPAWLRVGGPPPKRKPPPLPGAAASVTVMSVPTP